MYLDSHDYQTIWKLAHNWEGLDSDTTNENEIPQNLKITIHRIVNAVMWRNLSVRNRRWQIFADDSLLTFIFDFSHYRKCGKCLKSNYFSKSYLDSLYVKRPEVIAWCQKDFLPIPSIWQLGKIVVPNDKYDSSDDDNHSWYNELSERRKQRISCLEMARKLWLINPQQTYEDVFNHPTMKQFGNPSVFSFDAFKKWSRPFAPEHATTGGRPNRNN